jgi:hypothetical protein
LIIFKISTDRFQNKEAYLTKRREFIENDIHAQVEHLKAYLDQLEIDLKANLNKSCTNMSLNLEKFQSENETNLNTIKAEMCQLKENAFSYAYSYSKDNKKSPDLSIQHQSVDKCFKFLNDVEDMNDTFSDMLDDLQFNPNVDLPGKSLIGSIKRVKHTSLKESLNKDIKSYSHVNRVNSITSSHPISPRYMCLIDRFNLLFTDSQTKHLIQLDVDTNDFVRSTNLNGQLRNPDGICINPITGHIYVSDGELKVIFKLDSKFNLIKKFGQRDLKWPRGMFYDSDELDDINHPNRLYVCDYSNQCIVIFNSNEQLRDCLTLTPDDKILPNFSKRNSVNLSNLNLHVWNHTQHLPNDEENKFCPLNVLVTKSNIYVTDDWTGGNCIRIFDKQTHMLLRNVGDLNAWNPLGLLVDHEENIFAIARLYYESGATNLFCFSKNGELLYQKNLNINNECVSDLLLAKSNNVSANQRLICIGEKKFHFFEF